MQLPAALTGFSVKSGMQFSYNIVKREDDFFITITTIFIYLSRLLLLFGGECLVLPETNSEVGNERLL